MTGADEEELVREAGEEVEDEGGGLHVTARDRGRREDDHTRRGEAGSEADGDVGGEGSVGKDAEGASARRRPQVVPEGELQRRHQRRVERDDEGEEDPS